MKVNKIGSFFLFVGILILIGLLYQSIWYLGGTANGKVVEFDRGPGKRFKHIESVTISYTVSNRIYEETYLRSGIPLNSETVSIRYLPFAPSISRLNTPTGNWGLVSGVFLVFFLSLSIVFLKKDMIPSRSVFVFSLRQPFIKLETDIASNLTYHR